MVPSGRRATVRPAHSAFLSNLLPQSVALAPKAGNQDFVIPMNSPSSEQSSRLVLSLARFLQRFQPGQVPLSNDSPRSCLLDLRHLIPVRNATQSSVDVHDHGT
jgi:hypothetical protein